MNMRTGVLLGVLVISLGLAYWFFNIHERPVVVSQATAPAAGPSSVPSLKTPRALLDEIKQDLQLKPDRRLVMALQKLRELGGAAPARLEFLFHAPGEWELVTDGESSGHRIKHLPSFEQIKAFVNRYAAEQMAVTTLSTAISAELSAMESAAESTDPVSLLRVLRKINGIVAAKGLSIQSLTLSAKALVRLVLINPDRLATSDQLTGDALALLALAQSVGGQALILEESLLASEMGYSSHAQALVAKAGNQTWQVYQTPGVRMLKTHAGARGGYTLERYLYLRDLARKDKYNDWVLEVLNDPDLVRNPVAALSTGYLLTDFSIRTSISEFMPHLVLVFLMQDMEEKIAGEFSAQARGDSLLDLGRKYSDLLYTHLTANDEQLFDEFESRLEKSKAAYTGPVLNAESYSGYFQGYLYTSFYLLALHYLDRYSHVESAKKFHDQFAGADSPRAAQFVSWYGNLVAAEQGNPDLNKMLGDLREMDFFGAAPLLRTFGEQLSNYGYGHPLKQKISSFILEKMDSRMWHRHEYASIMKNNYLFLSRAEEVYRSIAGAGLKSGSSAMAWLGKYNDDPAAILAVANEQSLSPKQRTYALDLAADFPGLHEQVVTVYETLLGQYPGEWIVFGSYLGFLEKSGNHAKVIEVATQWLSKKFKNRDPFDDWRAIIAVSEAQLALGDPAAAWATVQPYLGSYYGPMFYQATRVLIVLKDLENADKLSKLALERYPNGSKALRNRLMVLWSKGDFTQAAQTLKNFPQPLSVEDWRYDVGRIFIEQFRVNPKAGILAFDAMLQAGVAHSSLREVAVALGKEELHQLAFDLQSKLRFPGPGQINYDVEAYKFLKSARGKEAALGWLEQRIPAQHRNFASVMFYTHRQPDLIWEMIPQPELGPHPDAVWLYRAAIQMEGFPGDSQRLAEYYDSAGDGNLDRLGKYLLGQLPENEITGQPMTADQLCEAAYYLGIKALSEKRYYDAADWFKVAISTSRFNSAEYRWAYDYLYVWYTRDKNLDVLAAQGELIMGRPQEWQDGLAMNGGATSP